MISSKNSPKVDSTVLRARVWFVLVVLIFATFAVRLFYLQVIRHEHYQDLAKADQLKEYEIPASRGAIKAYSGGEVVPLVMNQRLYTVYADPVMVKDANKAADAVTKVLGGDRSKYLAKIQTKETRYAVLMRRATEDQKKSLLSYKLPGIGAQAQEYRIYPNGSLASQTLGFVDNEGKGKYGIEQAMNQKLSGVPGKLKAVTDVNGVPLASSPDNVLEQAKSGADVTLTLDIAMQRQTEKILQEGLKTAKSDNGSIVVMDANTGAIKAMANWPTYDPAQFYTVEKGETFLNSAVTDALEVGSTMKPLTMAAALDSGTVKNDTTYYDPAKWEIDGYKITNIEEDGGAGTKTMPELLNLSLNTGATWLLMKMGDNDHEITKKGREVWHDYMVNHFGFGSATGVEQGFEGEGIIPDPNKGYGLNITYANTSFGQGMTATPLQMAAAYSAVLNGGTYYKPRLVDSYNDINTGKVIIKKPEAVRKGVVASKTSTELQQMMEYVVDNHYFKRKFDQNVHSVGGKTGTAQIAKKGGGYEDKEFNGTYLGFVGGNRPEYVVAVVVYKPKIGGYAGSQAAQPIFGEVAHALIDNFNVPTKN